MPGVDVLIAGLVILAQEERRVALAFYVLLCIVLQEGIGSQPFGASILWYAGTLIPLLFGRGLLGGHRFLFVLLLACLLCPLYFAIVYSLASLQELPVDTELLTARSIEQTISLPIAWLVAMCTRIRREAHVFPS